MPSPTRLKRRCLWSLDDQCPSGRRDRCGQANLEATNAACTAALGAKRHLRLETPSVSRISIYIYIYNIFIYN